MRHLDVVVQTGLLKELDILIGILPQDFDHQLAAGDGVVYQERFLQRNHRRLGGLLLDAKQAVIADMQVVQIDTVYARFMPTGIPFGRCRGQQTPRRHQHHQRKHLGRKFQNARPQAQVYPQAHEYVKAYANQESTPCHTVASPFSASSISW